jgi:hypothetical protein
MKKFFVLFSLFFLIYFFAAGVAIAGEYMTLRPSVTGIVYVRSEPTTESDEIGRIWATQWYGQSFVKVTGKTQGEWLQVEAVYYGYPEIAKPEVKYGWVHGNYFTPAQPEKDGFIFFKPTKYKIYQITIYKAHDLLDSSYGHSLSSNSIFSLIGVKFVCQEDEWIEIEPLSEFIHDPGYVLADYFGLKPEVEMVIFKKPERYNIAKRWTYSHKGPDIRSYDVRAYNQLYSGEIREIYIVGKKGHWMLTVNNDWVLAQHLVKFPLCLL